MTTYFTYANLDLAYRQCRKRKSNSLYCLKFSDRLEENLLQLERELQERTYRPGRSIAFIVQKPKVREIFAADFRDRVIHHLLYNYLSPIFEPVFIYDSWACRRGKGTHRALRRTQRFVCEADSAGFSASGYYLKMDIKSFFTSIDQQILFTLIAKQIKNKEILWLTGIIIFHDCVRDVIPKMQSHPSLFAKLPADKSLFTVPHGKGLPIGNLTSQFFANVYLDRLDQYIKHELKVSRYLRYVDDLLIIGENQPTLEIIRHKITEFTSSQLALTVHPKKQFIRPINSGIDFVGFIIRPEYTLLRRRVVGEWRWKLQNLPTKKTRLVFCSYNAQANWANTHFLRQKMVY